MKLFGTVNSFDIDQGRGSIKPEVGGDAKPFRRIGSRQSRHPYRARRCASGCVEQRNSRRANGHETAAWAGKWQNGGV